ncbi:hypothetical protein H2200_012751 [Cladophialophora chaetospira]|uniref:Tautomerase cis-CaaD-like domain-containing protein n=1 Tax=Cladophialophora chaetospira TaxID=386627 RepID=A0AA38WXJ6_9EURO|nr:hypothetical protein H2200_012751 [Cladophialophora chaetospira]
MPTYEFHHILPLKRPQKAQLAQAVTDWHAVTFRAPRFVVNCRFISARDIPAEDSYIGGRVLNCNKLFVSLRSRIRRTPEQYLSMTKTLQRMWDEAVQDSAHIGSGKELKDVFIMGTIDSTLKRGWFLPMPGHFEKWVKENTKGFQKQAETGDTFFEDLVQEIGDRPEFQ